MIPPLPVFNFLVLLRSLAAATACLADNVPFAKCTLNILVPLLARVFLSSEYFVIRSFRNFCSLAWAICSPAGYRSASFFASSGSSDLVEGAVGMGALKRFG